MFESVFKELINKNVILEKHKSLLKVLSDDKIMMICYDKDGSYYMMECCDEWYYHNLSKEECIELSELFKEIAEVID